MKYESYIAILFWGLFILIPVGCFLAFIWGYEHIILARIAITSLVIGALVLAHIITLPTKTDKQTEV